jgi:hypothetical protein
LENKSLGGPLILAALLLALSIVGSGYFLSKSIDRGSQKLDALVTALQEMPKGAAPAPSQRAARPGRPDPSKRYDIAVGSAPTKGPKNAAVTIVEWSDFQ